MRVFRSTSIRRKLYKAISIALVVAIVGSGVLPRAEWLRGAGTGVAEAASLPYHRAYPQSPVPLPPGAAADYLSQPGLAAPSSGVDSPLGDTLAEEMASGFLAPDGEPVGMLMDVANNTTPD